MSGDMGGNGCTAKTSPKKAHRFLGLFELRRAGTSGRQSAYLLVVSDGPPPMKPPCHDRAKLFGNGTFWFAGARLQALLMVRLSTKVAVAISSFSALGDGINDRALGFTVWILRPGTSCLQAIINMKFGLARETTWLLRLYSVNVIYALLSLLIFTNAGG